MPNDPTLRTDIAATKPTTGHWAATDTVHGVINKIYKAIIGATRTASFTVAQSLSGETVPINTSSDVVVTVPILATGTVVEFVRVGSGAVTFTPAGVSLVKPADVTAEIRAQGGSATLLWLTSTSVLLAGELTRG